MMYKNFTLEEFVASDTAKARGIDNNPPAEAVAHIGELVGSILQPLRDAWGKPIRITSGYRSQQLNKAVGGVETSAHQYGYAADTQPNDMSDFDKYVTFVREWLRVNNIAYDQCIVEKSGTSKWVHIAVRNAEEKQRRQCFNMFL